MAATTVIYRYTGAGPTGADVSAGIKFTRDDSNTGSTPVPIPPSGTAATNFSYYASIALYVTANTGSTISNKRIYYTGSMPSGFQLFSQTAATSPAASNSYTQCTAAVTATATTVATPPTGYAAMTTSTAGTVFDASSAVISTNTIASYYCRVCLGVDNTATTTGTVSLPTIYILYDEQ